MPDHHVTGPVTGTITFCDVPEDAVVFQLNPDLHIEPDVRIWFECAPELTLIAPNGITLQRLNECLGAMLDATARVVMERQHA